MGVKVKTTKDAFPKISATVEALNGKKVKVGVLTGENQWLAGIHEYGCSIPVTDKMRVYLHHRGIHLKKSTTVIVIPERSFLRAGFDANAAEIETLGARWAKLATDGTVSADEAMERIGKEVADIIRDYARDLRSPPNSTWTTDWKGSTNPLVDTGDMIGGITYEVN